VLIIVKNAVQVISKYLLRETEENLRMAGLRLHNRTRGQLLNSYVRCIRKGGVRFEPWPRSCHLTSVFSCFYSVPPT